MDVIQSLNSDLLTSASAQAISTLLKDEATEYYVKSAVLFSAYTSFALNM